MDEQNVVVSAATGATETEHTEPAKIEPVKNEEVDRLKAEVDKLKASLSKANSEAAEYKRQRNEQMDKSKLAEVERAEQEKSMREELETLLKEKAVSEYTAKCVTLKMDADLASKTANALADGNIDAVFDCLKAFVEATVTKANNDALNRQPGLSAGIPPTSNTTNDADIEKMRRWAGLPVHR